MLERPKFFSEIIRPSQKISFDADGVLIYSAVPVVAEFNQRYKTNYRPEDIKNWFSVKHWALEIGMVDEEADKLNYEIWTNPAIIEKSPPVPGSLEIFRYFLKEDFDPYVITVRNSDLRSITFGWFEKFLPELPKENIHMRDGFDISGDDFKIGMIKSLKINWHIEDSADVISLVLDKTEAKVIHIAYPGEIDKIGKTDRVIVIPRDDWYTK